MRINIDKDFYIERDEYNYTLRESKHKKDKKGNDVYVNHGYHGNLEQALRRLKRIRVESVADALSLDEYIKESKKQHDELVRLLKDVD